MFVTRVTCHLSPVCYDRWFCVVWVDHGDGAGLTNETCWQELPPDSVRMVTQ